MLLACPIFWTYASINLFICLSCVGRYTMTRKQFFIRYFQYLDPPVGAFLAKSDQKFNFLTNIDRAYIFSPIDSSRWVDHFSALVCQNRMKDGQVIAIQKLADARSCVQFWRFSGHILAIFWDRLSIFSLPIIYIKIHI